MDEKETGCDCAHCGDIDQCEAAEMAVMELQMYIYSIDSLCKIAHDIAKMKGFWPEGQDRNDGEMIALIHTELSEMLEGIRHGNPQSEHIPQFTAAEEEAADVCIRLFDMAAARGWKLGEAILKKMDFNLGREHKHGKQF